MTTVFLKILGSFFYERMVESVPSDFTKMVGMGIRLKEAVREGRLSRDEGSSGTKKQGYGFSIKKEGDTNVITQERRSRPMRMRHQHQHQVASIIPVVNVALNVVAYQKHLNKVTKGKVRKGKLLIIFR